ncbi:MAG: aminotransferase class V-fold PLP-dependent enzyme [Dehalococcoidales bacterium]|nr:aminotransferase class V-fold PLP-dependent enzyme [Dehalococcoidales bacterium]
MIELRRSYTPVEELPQSGDHMHSRNNGHNELNVREIRKHFFFRKDRRTVTNNAATTQVPYDLLRLHASLAKRYENVHRGQSKPSQEITALLEESYQTVADFLNAPSIRNLVFYRNTTEAINSVMYALLTEFRNGDNIVTTMMEHNSNYVPWYAMCRDILPRFGVNVECRIVSFDQESGELDLDHMDRLIDSRTKLVCCTGASNFLGYKSPISLIRELSRGSGYSQPNGASGSYLLIDGAQLVPSTPVDVQQMNVDFLAFSFHKMLAPFGTGVLYAREELLDSLPPFLYGGDMIAEGQVHPESVSYNKLPWKYTAGTPNILGNIVSAQALRLILDFALRPDRGSYFRSDKKIDKIAVKLAMGKVNSYLQWLTQEAMIRMVKIPGIKIYGPVEVEKRAPLISFNINGINPITLANKLAERGVEVRAGCHCATLAHHYLGLDPPASCRLSFYIYNDIEDVERAVDAVKCVALPIRQRTLFSYLKNYEHKLRGIRRII